MSLVPHQVQFELRSLRERVQRWLPRARSLAQEIARDPASAKQTLGHLLEERSPALSRAFLSAASSLATPFTAGMGMTIERLDDAGCVAALPDWWRNRDEAGRPHAAAMCALVQFASHAYWTRHLDPATVTARLARLECRWAIRGGAGASGPRGRLQATYALADDEREHALLRVRADGRARVARSAQIYDSGGQLVAEADVEWEFASQALLGARA